MRNTTAKISQYNTKIFLRVNELPAEDKKEIINFINLQMLEITKLFQQLNKLDELIEALKGGD